VTTVTERIGGRLAGRQALPSDRSDGEVAAPPDLRPTPPRRARDRRALVAVGSLVVIGASIATFAGLYASAGRRTAAIVVDRPLTQGQPITAADLGEADVSVSGGVRYIPVADASVIQGKRAASAIPAGSLLTPGDLATAPAIAAGDAVVGVALKDGQYPAAGLAPGQRVLIVQTGTPGSPLSAPAPASSAATPPTTATDSGSALVGTGAGVLVPVATVVSVSSPGSASGGNYALLVSVEVSAAVAPVVATASSADQVGLVLLPATATATATGRITATTATTATASAATTATATAATTATATAAISTAATPTDPAAATFPAPAQPRGSRR
jgi:hypothetical protein